MRSLAGGRTRRLGSARRAVAAPVQQRLAARAGCTLPAAALPASSRLNASTEAVPTVGDLAGEAGDANAKDALLADLQAADGPNLGHVGTSAEQQAFAEPPAALLDDAAVLLGGLTEHLEGRTVSFEPTEEVDMAMALGPCVAAVGGDNAASRVADDAEASDLPELLSGLLSPASAPWVLLGLSVLYGCNTTLVELGGAQSGGGLELPAAAQLALRLGVGALALSPALPQLPRLASSNASDAGADSSAWRRCWRDGVELGAYLALGYGLQSQAMADGASVAVASCAMALSVVFSPAIEAARGDKPSGASLGASALALAGAVAFFGAGLDLSSDGFGDAGVAAAITPEHVLLLAGSALAFSVHMVRTHETQTASQRAAGARSSPLAVCATQMASASAFAALLAASQADLAAIDALAARTLVEHGGLLDTGVGTGLAALAVSGVVTVGFCQAVEMYTLPLVGASTTSLIYGTIPLFGAVLGVALFGDNISHLQLLGGAAMILAPGIKVALDAPLSADDASK